MARINWKKRALELEDQLEKAEGYIFDYGNASGSCESGYYQHPNYICHHCNQDRSVKKVCGLNKKKREG